MGLSGGGSSKQTTKSSTTPWKAAKPYIKDSMAQLQDSYGQAKDTIANYSPALNAAIGQIQNNIANPAGYNVAARNQLEKTINGDYLDAASNPYASGMADLIASKTQGNYNSTFGASGRSHGGLAALLSSQGVGDALNSFYGGIYESERGRQQQAMALAPTFHADDYTDINQLFPAVENTAMMPLKAATGYSAGITGASSPYSNSKQTTTVQQPGMSLGQMIGAGLQIASMFTPAGPATAAMSAAGSGLALSDPKSKVGMVRIGDWDDRGDGLGRWRFAYRGAPAVLHEGVNADEVARLRPAALGPTIGNYRTVNYSMLEAA